jgi:large subunit ribosomal protein L28
MGLQNFLLWNNKWFDLGIEEVVMSQKCMITGKKPLVGNHVSHANNKVKRRQNPNLQWKKIYIPEMDRYVRVRLTTRALRTINKKGFLSFLKDNGLKLKDLT